MHTEQIAEAENCHASHPTDVEVLPGLEAVIGVPCIRNALLSGICMSSGGKQRVSLTAEAH